MIGLTPFGLLIAAWSVVTVALATLLIIRSLIGMKEDDQLFLDPAEAMLEAEQKEVLNKLNHLEPYVRAFAIGSGGLLLAIAGVLAYRIYQALGA